MIKDLKKIKKSLAEQKLSAVEKTAMRSVLLSFIKDNPISITNQSASQVLVMTLSFLKSKTILTTLSLALVLAVSSGVSLAAEQSLPGDLLYPIKVKVNENVVAAAHLSTEAKVKWETEKFARRLEEFEKLQVENRLDNNTTVHLQNTVTIQAEKIEDLTNQLEDNLQVATSHSRLEAVLKSHSQILITLSDSDNKKDEKTNEGVASVALDIAKKTRAAADNRIEAQQKLSNEKNDKLEASANNQFKTVKNKLAEVKKFLNRKADQLGAETKAHAEATLAAAVQVSVEGQTHLEAKQYSEALIKFQESMRLAQEAKIIASASNKLNIDLRPTDNRNYESKSDDDDNNSENTQRNSEENNRSRIDNIIEQANQIKTRFQSDWHDDDDSESDDTDENKPNPNTIEANASSTININLNL